MAGSLPCGLSRERGGVTDAGPTIACPLIPSATKMVTDAPRPKMVTDASRLAGLASVPPVRRRTEERDSGPTAWNGGDAEWRVRNEWRGRARNDDQDADSRLGLPC